MKEIRFHGRGGQGAVTSAEMLAMAAIESGNYAQAFPSFGPERRGAPVLAFARVADRPIRQRSRVYEPDFVVVLDPSLLKILNPAEGLKPGGIMVINTHKSAEEIRKKFGYRASLALVDADRIAHEVLGIPITNTTMLGALVRATGVVTVDSLKAPLNHRFGRIAAKNIAALARAFEETVVYDA